MIADRLLGLVFLAVALAAGLSVWNLVVPFAADPLGPRPFPLTIALIMGLCGLLLLWRPVHRFDPPERWAGPPLLVAALLVYAMLMVPAGFMPATAITAAAVALLFGARLLQAAATGLVTAVLLWALFDRLLDLPLPKGILPL
ncbi:MAG: tripartite tricarboxylate transporter TctB family protein [Rhodovarius sp.]|nr:tripartite tricarboxylate transporter TctB family protein [Rhodovarius sp.]MDW8314495.1 tripartite tricarboxylate transporter TctB family protein [Rhodovarius sp.]